MTEEQYQEMMNTLINLESNQNLIINYLDALNQLLVEVSDYALFGVIVLSIVGGIYIGLKMSE